MSKIDNTIELFKSHDLIKWNRYRYVWTQKAYDLAEKNGYSIASNFTCGDNNPDVVWLQTLDDEFGFGWVEENNEKYDEYVKMTLKVFDIVEDDIIPIDVEDIVL